MEKLGNDCPLDEDCCSYAAQNGYIEVLKFLHENDCPWDEDCCSYALKKDILIV